VKYTQFFKLIYRPQRTYKPKIRPPQN